MTPASIEASEMGRKARFLSSKSQEQEPRYQYLCPMNLA
jgi:hypothetical protein